MRGNKFCDIVTGAMIGFLLGTLYYMFTAKLLFCGPIVSDQILMPDGMWKMLFALSVKYGGIAGIVIGVLGGNACPITKPRGHMSKSISCTSFLFCTIMALIQHGHFLAEMSNGRIVIAFFFIILTFFLAIPIGDSFSLIERIRE